MERHQTPYVGGRRVHSERGVRRPDLGLARSMASRTKALPRVQHRALGRVQACPFTDDEIGALKRATVEATERGGVGMVRTCEDRNFN